MYNHEPGDYECPFCLLLKGQESRHNRLADIVYEDEFVTAFVAPKWWINNPGHVLVIPNQHFENIYDIPDELLAKVHVTAKRIALALKQSYHCDRTSTRQHNEPDGGQDVWHLHVHVYPRYKDDNLYQNHDHKRFVEGREAQEYASKLKEALGFEGTKLRSRT